MQGMAITVGTALPGGARAHWAKRCPYRDSSCARAAARSGSPASRSHACPYFGPGSAARPLRGWLATSLSELDGSELGAIQLFDKQDGDCTGADKAALAQLSQMASAAAERRLPDSLWNFDGDPTGIVVVRR